VFAIALLCAGCGSGAASPKVDGKALFAENCATCHSLTGRQSPRQQGGDLLSLRMSEEEMLEFVREMPVRHPLSSTQQRAVADYVRALEARAYFPGARGQ
jgi:mono/diheme cytochrome c family protein